jgi:murein DD-endopeptidase MepM/ murein hydrolase activator NlpD
MNQIQASVGRNGVNQPHDVRTVQTLLGECRHLLGSLPAVALTGSADADTIRAIEEFQRRVLFMQNPDGRVDPGGRTLRTLIERRQGAGAEVAAGAIPAPGIVRFPMDSRPAASYKDGSRFFGANRDRGRKHAGCDLLAPIGTPVYAMDDGEVIQNLYHFYKGSYALEIRHPNFVARYAEIGPNIPPGLKTGAKVKRGQLIGHVGKMEGITSTMLHLEIYAGTVSGQLTVEGNPPYKRRSDLLDPTPILDGASTA